MGCYYVGVKIVVQADDHLRCFRPRVGFSRETISTYG